ncbi:MAG: YhjR family protein [Candidatus Oceanisphaera merdipullorum]|nr:YhjR family protein [Candidatus Oceanisphaera merdipullorum]
MKQQAHDKPKASWASNTTDDLNALSQLMSLPELAYQDIGQQQQLAQIVARWPLLNELSLATSADVDAKASPTGELG